MAHSTTISIDLCVCLLVIDGLCCGWIFGERERKRAGIDGKIANVAQCTHSNQSVEYYYMM